MQQPSNQQPSNLEIQLQKQLEQHLLLQKQKQVQLETQQLKKQQLEKEQQLQLQKQQLENFKQQQIQPQKEKDMPDVILADIPDMYNPDKYNYTTVLPDEDPNMYNYTTDMPELDKQQLEKERSEKERSEKERFLAEKYAAAYLAFQDSRVNKWVLFEKAGEVGGVPKSNVEGYKANLKIILGLQDDQFEEISQIINQSVKECEENSFPCYRKYNSKNEDVSLYFYFLCKKEPFGKFSFATAIHKVEFELVSQDGEPKIENLDIEYYTKNLQEEAVWEAIEPFFINYGAEHAIDERHKFENEADDAARRKRNEADDVAWNKHKAEQDTAGEKHKKQNDANEKKKKGKLGNLFNFPLVNLWNKK